MEKVDQWLEEEGLILLEAWARDGMNHDEIARRMGVGRSTLYSWKQQHPPIAEALRRGREVIDAMVEKALLEKALGGDLRAQMYWLNNRREEQWAANPADKIKNTREDGLEVIVDV